MAQAGVLWQNNGAQAIAVSAIANFRAQTQIPTFLAATAHPRFQPLLASVAVVSAQPLKFMQNFGGFTDEFLYERLGSNSIKLKPGVAYCLRHFYPLVCTTGSFALDQTYSGQSFQRGCLGVRTL